MNCEKKMLKLKKNIKKEHNFRRTSHLGNSLFDSLKGF